MTFRNKAWKPHTLTKSHTHTPRNHGPTTRNPNNHFKMLILTPGPANGRACDEQTESGDDATTERETEVHTARGGWRLCRESIPPPIWSGRHRPVGPTKKKVPGSAKTRRGPSPTSIAVPERASFRHQTLISPPGPPKNSSQSLVRGPGGGQPRQTVNTS